MTDLSVESFAGYLACASYDLDDWFRVPTEWDPDKGVITIKHTSTQVSPSLCGSGQGIVFCNALLFAFLTTFRS